MNEDLAFVVFWPLIVIGVAIILVYLLLESVVEIVIDWARWARKSLTMKSLAELLLDLLIKLIGSSYHRIWLFSKYPGQVKGQRPLNKRERALVFCASFFTAKKS